MTPHRPTSRAHTSPASPYDQQTLAILLAAATNALTWAPNVALTLHLADQAEQRLLHRDDPSHSTDMVDAALWRLLASVKDPHTPREDLRMRSIQAFRTLSGQTA